MSTSNPVHDVNDDSVKFLAPFIDAAREDMSDESCSDAATRLRARLPHTQNSSGRRKSMFRFGTAAALLTVVLLVGQTFMTGNSSTAFAAVQKWFSDFRNVHVITTISSANSVVVDVEVWALANGTVRIEQSGMVQILDSEAATFYTLMPDSRYFTMALPANPSMPQAIDWFEDVREFQGEAVRIQESRLVSGINAQGYHLQADGVDLTLWADPVSHRPLLLEGALPGGLRMISELEFDTDMQRTLFEIPHGYEQIVAEQDE